MTLINLSTSCLVDALPGKKRGLHKSLGRVRQGKHLGPLPNGIGGQLLLGHIFKFMGHGEVRFFDEQGVDRSSFGGRDEEALVRIPALEAQILGNILDSKFLRCPDLKDEQFEAPLFIPDIGEPFSFEAFEIIEAEGRNPWRRRPAA